MAHPCGFPTVPWRAPSSLAHLQPALAALVVLVQRRWHLRSITAQSFILKVLLKKSKAPMLDAPAPAPPSHAIGAPGCSHSAKRRWCRSDLDFQRSSGRRECKTRPASASTTWPQRKRALNTTPLAKKGGLKLKSGSQTHQGSLTRDQGAPQSRGGNPIPVADH